MFLLFSSICSQNFLPKINLIIPSIIRNSIYLLPDHKALRVGKTQVKGEQLQPQTTRTEGDYRSLLFHPLSHRDRDNHSTQKWPSGLTGWPTDFDTNWFSLTGKCLHNYLKRNLFFIECILQCNTHTTPLTPSISKRNTNPQYFSRTGATRCRPSV